MEMSKEGKSSLVPDEAKQGEEIRSRWAWVEPTIWTDRMLTALENGVKGGKWFSLADKAFSPACLMAAFTKVKANNGAPGVDGWTAKRFARDLDRSIALLSKELMDGSYRPRPCRRVWIPKPGSKEKRPLGIPTVRDRVVQTAIKSALEPVFENEFLDTSFGFRPGRSMHKALSRIWRGLRSGRQHVVDADLRRFFDTIPHDAIMSGLEEKVSDGKVLGVVRLFLAQGVMEGWTVKPGTEGTPQGSVISPLLANIALHGLDVKAASEGYELIRYADDFVVLCTDSEQAASALDIVEAWTQELGLVLHPEKTRLVDYGAGESFEFLGYVFKRGNLYARKKSQKKFRASVRDQTPRTSGRSLRATISKLNPIVRGWYRHFKACHPSVFTDMDGFVRRRLRAILDRRRGKHPAFSGATHLRWPNAYFANEGLLSMRTLAKESILSRQNH